MLLRWIPPLLHRKLYRLANEARKLMWKITRPRLHGCRAVALDPEGRVLLVRQSYGPKSWLLPGGGMGLKSDPVASAAREMLEETGCILRDGVLVEQFEIVLHGARILDHLVVGTTTGPIRADEREIIEAGFFALDALPSPLYKSHGEGLRRWIDEWERIRAGSGCASSIEAHSSES